MEHIDLSYFPDAKQRHYHIYKIENSALNGKLHSHDYYSFCYVVQGTILHRLQGQSVALTHGDAFLTPPGVAHCLEFPSDGCEIYSLSVDLSLFHEGFPGSELYKFLMALQMTPQQDALRCKVTLDPAQRLSMKALLESLIREWDTQYTPSAASGMICAILYILAQSYAADPVRKEHLRAVSGVDSNMELCVSYVDAHFREPLSMPELCRMFAVSGTTFSLQFPKLAGAPLKRYITAKRMEEASGLISTTNKSLTEIAEIVGYSEFSAFYRNFVKHFGCAPSVYRK